MKTLSFIINIVIFITTLIIDIFLFRPEGKWDKNMGRYHFRFFTVQSNTLCAIGALLTALFCLRGPVPGWVVFIKYLGTASVTVTLLTVVFYLSRFIEGGLRALLQGANLYMHLLGPLFAIISYCFLEKQNRRFAYHLLGLIPVILYAGLYLYKVVILPEEKGWEDFYGFNKDGKWKISVSAMIAGTFVICILLWLL